MIALTNTCDAPAIKAGPPGYEDSSSETWDASSLTLADAVIADFSKSVDTRSPAELPRSSPPLSGAGLSSRAAEAEGAQFEGDGVTTGGRK